MIRYGATMNDVEDKANEYLESFWETLSFRDFQSLRRNTEKTQSFSFNISTPRKVMGMTHMCHQPQHYREERKSFPKRQPGIF